MNKKIEQGSYIDSGKWDEKTIDQVYATLLDAVGDILDGIQVSACRALFSDNAILQTVQQLFVQLEKELLLQWKIKQDGGLQGLFERQKAWLNFDLRSSEGMLATWNRYCELIWSRMALPDQMMDQKPLRAILLEILFDPEPDSFMSGIMKSSQRDQILGGICGVFEKLYQTCPYHQFLSYLNLVEIGTGKRLEISNPGELNSSIPAGRIQASTGLNTSESLGENEWKQMPQAIIRFWERNRA